MSKKTKLAKSSRRSLSKRRKRYFLYLDQDIINEAEAEADRRQEFISVVMRDALRAGLGLQTGNRATRRKVA